MGSFGKLRTWRFRNTPYFSKSTSKWLRYEGFTFNVFSKSSQHSVEFGAIWHGFSFCTWPILYRCSFRCCLVIRLKLDLEMPSRFFLAVGSGLPGSQLAARSRQFLTQFKFRLLAILPRLPELPFLWSSKLYFFFSFSTGLKACRALLSTNPYFFLNLWVIEGYFLPANLCSKTNCWVRKITITSAVQQLCVSLTWHDGMTQ